MRRYFYAVAYAVVVGFLLATMFIVIPNMVVRIFEGKVGFSDFFQTVFLIPFIAGAAGCVLAGVPAVLAGLCMAFFNRFHVIVFLVVTVVVSSTLEFGYCLLLNIKDYFIPQVVLITAITSFCLSVVWRFWLDKRIG